MAGGAGGAGRTGTILVLNGPSSSGKSSIAAQLQEHWASPLISVGIDSIIMSWPARFTSAAGHVHHEPPEAGIVIVPGDGPAPSFRPSCGPAFARFARRQHRSWVEIAESGFDVVVDHVTFDATLREIVREELSDAILIGVHCDVEELVRREHVRGDRHVGFASGSWAECHREMVYDLEVDSTTASSEELCEQILAFLSERSSPGAHMRPGWSSGTT